MQLHCHLLSWYLVSFTAINLFIASQWVILCHICLSAIYNFLMTNWVGTMHLRQTLLKTWESHKENNRNAQNSFHWQCQRKNRLLSGYLDPKVGKLLLKSVRAQVIPPQKAQTQKKLQKFRKTVTNELLLCRLLAGWTSLMQHASEY
jgi:hypothetical protein